MKFNNFKTKVVTTAAIVATSVTTAQAALPTAAQDAVDSVTLFVNDMIDVAWPILTIVVGATVGFKLFKKFVNTVT